MKEQNKNHVREDKINRPIDFINELEPSFIAIMSGQSWHKPFKTSNELKKWCMDNQPYYKNTYQKYLIILKINYNGNIRRW